MNQRAYHRRISNRMFDFKEFYLRMARQLPGKSVIAEVGIADGASAVFMAETMLDQGKRFRLHLIDSLDYGGVDQLTTIMRHVVKAEISHVTEILPLDSLNASCRFPDNYFDFVFIDASHKLEETKADIRLWFQKVKVDGILAGHDYNDGEGAGVKQAVDTLIPRQITRAAIPNQQTFEPENVLHTEATANGCGVWWMEKKFYFNL